MGPAPARVRDDLYRDACLKRRLIHVLDAMLLVLAVAVTYMAVHLRYPPQQATGGDDVGTVARAENWMAANLPAGARVGVDSTVADDVASRGRPTVDVLSNGGTDWHTDTYILSTPELRIEATGDRGVAGALGSSLPIAVFGDRTARVELREIASDGVFALTRRWRLDVAARALAGTGLLRNPRVRADPLPRAVLQRGGLDLRAAVLVALLAAKTDVRIMGIATDPGEAAAGMPARRVRISIAHPATSLAAALAMLPPAYRPSSVTPLPGGARQLQWPVAMAPMQSLS